MQFDGVKRLSAHLNEAESYHVLHRHGLLRLRSSLAPCAASGRPLEGNSVAGIGQAGLQAQRPLRLRVDFPLRGARLPGEHNPERR
jgi:hypothetical protein